MKNEDKNLKQFFDPVRSDLNKFDKLIEEHLYSDSALIQSVLDYLLEKRGKRIRPTFLFLTAHCANMVDPRMIPTAMAIELIHTATLLHDDVVDEADTRRGQKTVNAAWSNMISILMGDYLYTKAFRLLSATKSHKLIDRVSRATEQVSFGELRQIEESGNFDISEDEYLRIIAAKTGALFSTSAASGAILTKAPKREENRLTSFGEKVGISFQIADDLLDLIGDTQKIGKQIGSDLDQGKATLPLIHALDRSSRKVRSEITGILSNGTQNGDFTKVVEFIGNSGGVEYARHRACEFGDIALKLIRKYGPSPYYTAIENVVNFTITREN
ncbi:MAG: polyprenyl synthetase family protein [candidate division Zixibacteria bacterium]|nr:polyprenyl synthetase family protein [candidate division Zixibacteria bacterium]MBU1471162.1 polyprenyl synthetase family protein [candidate division Zixibacteria bacterium]MBU2625847.1 polyprenyl synthetase family protein [candidate division Zixibacteria bacterium]